MHDELMGAENLITPVILSGGSGTRLWPLSTDSKPKQFLNLTGVLSMFQQTLNRCEDSAVFAPPVIVGNEKHADLIKDQMREISISAQSIILEPCARNTAPAIALAALAMEDPLGVMLVMPSDHVISKVEVFRRAVINSLPLALARWMVTFGIQPSHPETGYGYIEKGEAIAGSEASFAAKRFVEKPNLENAKSMLDTGDFHWNAGIFLFRADTYLQAMKEHAPTMLEAATAAMEQSSSSDFFVFPDSQAFAAAPSDSIDYAIMEKANRVAVTPVDPGWSDVGSWDSLFEIGTGDDQANVISGDVTAMESRHNLIQADGVSVSTYGVENLIIIANENKIVVIPRGQSQNVKKIIEGLKTRD